MIQIYNPDNTNFSHNGDMTLFPTKCDLKTVLNGSWQMELEHPIDDLGRWKYIIEESVIKAPSFNGDQLFRVKEKEKSDSGVSATLEPIFMDAMNDCFLIDIRPTEKTGQQALDLMTAPNSKYSGESNITKKATAYYQFKNLIEAINGGEDNSFISRWGGEILFDNFRIHIDESIGTDKGIELLYGKNIPADGLTESVDTREVVTRIYPKAYNGYTITNNGYVDSDLINNYPIIKVAVMSFEDVKMRSDASEDDEENGVTICDTQAELDAALTQKCKDQFASGLDKPEISISADMVLLQNTVQYKDFSVLESVSLGDTIHCKHYKLGIETEARVIELTYDCLKEKVSSVVLGSSEYNYFDNVTSSVNKIDNVVRPDGSLIAEQIKGFIDGTYSQLRVQNSIAKKQDVRAILFEDLDPDSPTFGALGIGTQGIQISHERNANNTDWIWGTAVNSISVIADSIITGVLSDKSGNFYLDMDSGELNMKNGTFSGILSTNKNVKVGQDIIMYPQDEDNTSRVVNMKSFIIDATEHSWSGKEGTFTIENADAAKGNQTRIQIYHDSQHPDVSNINLSVESETEDTTLSIFGAYISANGDFNIYGNLAVNGNFTASGAKSRIVDTSRGKRELNAVESAGAWFQDYGESQTDKNGICKVEIDPIFLETVNTDFLYHCFLSPESEARLYVSDKGKDYFIVSGEPNTRFDWCITAKQRGYETIRLEKSEI